MTITRYGGWREIFVRFPADGRKAEDMYRKCPYCGASLDAGEICDCIEKAASGGNDTESGTEKLSTNRISNQICFVNEKEKKLSMKRRKNMDRYYLFQKLLILMADEAKIQNATMRNYSGDIEIVATCAGQDIKVKVSLAEEVAAGA